MELPDDFDDPLLAVMSINWNYWDRPIAATAEYLSNLVKSFEGYVTYQTKERKMRTVDRRGAYFELNLKSEDQDKIQVPEVRENNKYFKKSSKVKHNLLCRSFLKLIFCLLKLLLGYFISNHNP